MVYGKILLKKTTTKKQVEENNNTHAVHLRHAAIVKVLTNGHKQLFWLSSTSIAASTVDISTASIHYRDRGYPREVQCSLRGEVMMPD